MYAIKVQYLDDNGPEPKNITKYHVVQYSEVSQTLKEYYTDAGWSVTRCLILPFDIDTHVEAIFKLAEHDGTLFEGTT